jgi:hypothetical protein
LKFLGEVWAGQVCVGANQQELTTCAKKEGQEEEFFFTQDEIMEPGRGQ